MRRREFTHRVKIQSKDGLNPNAWLPWSDFESLDAAKKAVRNEKEGDRNCQPPIEYRYAIVAIQPKRPNRKKENMERPVLLPCPLCKGKGQYVDDGEDNQRVDCIGFGKTATDGCGVGIWMQGSLAEAGMKWNLIFPKDTLTEEEIEDIVKKVMKVY